jgi:hypothetical protein
MQPHARIKCVTNKSILINRPSGFEAMSSINMAADQVVLHVPVEVRATTELP